MRVHTDTRRKAICDIFGDATPGDVNVFIANPDQVTCWHKHERQTDWFFCLSGSITFRWWKAGVFHQETLAQGDEKIVTIPPNWWHGYRSGPNGSTVLMYLDRKYDEMDELRMTEAESGVPFP